MCILNDCLPYLDHLSQGALIQAPDCRDMACWRVSVTTWAFCPIRARVSRLRGGPQGSCTSTSLDALPRSSPFRETITQWDSAQNGYFDVPGIIGNTFQRRVLLKCIEWEGTGSIQFQFHSWTILQLPFRRVPYMLWPTHLSNCQLLLFCLFLWCIKVRGIFMFLLPARSSKSPSVISFYLVQIAPFFSFFLSLRSCIVVSSSWAVGASRVSHKHYGQAHFSQVDFPAILQDVSRQTADMWQTHVTPVSLH